MGKMIKPICVGARAAGRAGTGAAGGAVGELALVGRAVGPREPACRSFAVAQHK